MVMSQHPSQIQLAGYRERTLYADELLAVDSHLASCDVCHEELIRLARAHSSTRPVFEPADEPFHLDYEQHLEPYVDGTANDIEREIVDSHIALCSACAAELKDLLEFKEQPVAAIAGDTRKSSRWTGWLPQWPLLSNPAFATAVVLAALIVTIVVLWTMFPTSSRLEQADSVTPPSDKPNQTINSLPPSPAPTEHTVQENSNQSPQNGATVPAPPEQTLVTVYDADGQIVLTQRGRLEGVDDLPPDLRESVERALATRQLPASPGLTGWPTGAGRLRSELNLQSTFVPVGPTDVVVETDRPTFRWGALDAAQDYTVTVYDANGQVATSGPVTGTEWTTPNALARGITYSWQISALKDGERVVSPQPPLPEARFRILDQPAMSMLARLRETVGNSHLVMGVFYWKHGLLADSEREFEALSKANPKSAVVKALLANIRSFRPG